jgi:dTDP-4-amino-4,6-dideoxygalactose transaminase
VRNRDRVAERLRARGVSTGVHYSLPVHRQPAMRGIASVRGDLSRAEAWAREELSLPMSPSLRPDEVARAARACTRAVDPLSRWAR